MTHEKQYEVQIYENDSTLSLLTVDDPFVHSTVHPRGWRVAWAVLRGKYAIRFHVRGSREAHRVVFRGDYTPDPPGPPRQFSMTDQAEAASEAQCTPRKN